MDGKREVMLDPGLRHRFQPVGLTGRRVEPTPRKMIEKKAQPPVLAA